MNQDDFIIIDIETTGLSPANGNEITEIAAIHVSGHTMEVLDTFTTLVKTKLPVPYFITKLTGIDDRMLRNHGIDLNDALGLLADFCGSKVCYAHNANFDKGFLRFYYIYQNVAFKPTDWVDTISIFRKAFPGRKTYKLEALIQEFSLAQKEDHRALSDALHTLSLLKIARGIK